MSTFHMLAGAQRDLVTPIALRLTDDFTGGTPAGRVALFLDVKDGSQWRPVDRRPVRTPSDVYAFPNLERHAAPLGRPPRHYRVRIEAEYYRPEYLRNSDGIEFDAF